MSLVGNSSHNPPPPLVLSSKINYSLTWTIKVCPIHYIYRAFFLLFKSKYNNFEKSSII